MRSLLIFTLMSSGAFAADLNIYTYDSFTSEWGPGPQLEKDFEAQCGCDIVFTPAGDGAAMLSRLRIEGDKSDADIALGIDQNLVPLAEETGLFAPHELGEQKIEGANLTWSNPNFVAYDWGQFAFVYDSEKLETAPSSLKALAQSDISIIIEDPRASTPGLGLAMWVYDIYGEEAEAYWHELKDNIVTVTPGWSEAYSLFLNGEADMVLSYTTSPAYHRIAEGETKYQAAKFEEGQGLQIELAAVMRTSKNQELAKEFLSFLQGEQAQTALMNSNWMYPISALALPEGFDAPDSYKSVFDAVDASRLEAAKSAYENGMK